MLLVVDYLGPYALEGLPRGMLLGHFINDPKEALCQH